uniref:uncharacterized protein LOC113475552 isoform X2 n=1 Tax=Ciona intestinalis TaxID=7719 RepID=UPI000180ADD3|nr:uncharacterized protein LOC113475552 isoform X2 [Ciona intestinalis]|eukprot:XP_026695571.1 uncharacterized protein LOC113475552 isoform X2 [Ciona intestinalis]
MVPLSYYTIPVDKLLTLPTAKGSRGCLGQISLGDFWLLSFDDNIACGFVYFLPFQVPSVSARDNAQASLRFLHPKCPCKRSLVAFPHNTRSKPGLLQVSARDPPIHRNK